MNNKIKRIIEKTKILKKILKQEIEKNRKGRIWKKVKCKKQ